jgi:hypothetical protein
MKLNEFVVLVRDMRSLQKEYFRTRSQEVLSACKDLEANVDRAIFVMETSGQLDMLEGE